jgi:DNA-binding MarR family transcriptional regulator
MDLMSTENCMCFNLRRATRAITKIYDNALKPAGITSSQFTLLSIVAGNQPISMLELASDLGMDRTTLTRNLQLLIRDELVEAQTGDDQRQRLIKLGPKGRKRLDSAERCWQSVQSKVVDAFGQTEAQDLLQALASVGKSAEQNG